MARIETDPNYTSPTFSRATAVTDIFKDGDVQTLAAAFSTHVHDGAGKGLVVVPPSGSISAAALVDGSITTAKLVDGAVTTVKLAPGAVTTTQIADAAVNSAKIADGSLTGADIGNATIGGGNIAAGTITGGNIAAETITGANIANGSITWMDIAAGTITSANITPGTILGSNIAPETVTSNNIANGTITSADIGAGQVAGSNIAAGAVSAANLSTVDNFQMFGLHVTNNTTLDGTVNMTGGAVIANGTGGQVAIGTTPFSSYRLTLANLVSPAGQGMSQGWLTYACVDHARSANLQVVPISDATSKLRALPAYYYDHINLDGDQGTSAPTYGMSATEVAAVVPELAGDNSVDYGRLLCVLWTACQEMDARLTAVEAA